MSLARPAFLRRRADEARLAFMLLTRLPMGRMEFAPPLAAAVWAYPLVGAVVGALVGVVFSLASVGLPPVAAALLAIGAGVLLTGAMHEDGLADLADGFGGGGTRERKLEIMRDSRIGSYGVIALVLVLGLRAETLAALPAGGAVLRMVGLGALSRALLPVIMFFLPPARADGLGQAAGSVVAKLPMLAGLALAVILALPFGVLPAATMALVALALAILARQQIGGFTGDVLGAVQLLTETAGLCILATSR